MLFSLGGVRERQDRVWVNGEESGSGDFYLNSVVSWNSLYAYVRPEEICF